MIKIGNFDLEKLDIYGKHFGLVQGMSLDKKVQDYIDRDFLNWLGKYESVSEEKIEPCKMYVIKDGDREVGVVGSTSFDDGILNVVYAIKKNVRDRGYGQRILEEITMYYLDNIKGIKGIKLEIDGSNKASKGVASNNSYVKINDINKKGLEEWYYYNSNVNDRGRK